MVEQTAENITGALLWKLGSEFKMAMSSEINDYEKDLNLDFARSPDLKLTQLPVLILTMLCKNIAAQLQPQTLEQQQVSIFQSYKKKN